jgi:hypothetical protein
MFDDSKYGPQDGKRRLERLTHQADVDRAASEAGYVSPLRRAWNGLTLAGWRHGRKQKLADEYAHLTADERTTVDRLRVTGRPDDGQEPTGRKW